MKILFVSDNTFKIYNENAYSGGQLNYNMFSSKYLRKFDDVFVASRSQKVNKKNDIEDMSIANGENITHVTLPNISSLFFLKKYLMLKKEIRQYLKLVDALTVRLPGIYSLIAIKEARKMNKPYFIEVVGNTFEAYWYHGNIAGKLIGPISHYIMKREVEKSKYIIYVTEKYLQNIYKSNDKAITIEVSNVELKTVDDKILSNRIEKINGYDESTKYKIALIGTYSAKYKGIDTAIEAISMLKKSNIKIDLHILGSGNNSWLKEIAKKNNVIDQVYFDGILKSGEVVMSWLDDKDLYIHPSYTEGLPRSLIESMSRGIPCIASRVGGIPELLESELLHEAKDSQKLKQLLYECITDKEKLIKMSKNNFKKAQTYNIKKLSKKRQSFIGNFIEKEFYK